MLGVFVRGYPNTGVHIAKVQASVYSGRVPEPVRINSSLASEVLGVVVNNGKYVGSNAYWSKSKDHVRKVFHTHGQLQAVIAFLILTTIR